MVQEVQLIVDPQTAGEEHLLKSAIANKCNISANDIYSYRIEKKSIDARQRDIKINLKIRVFIGETEPDTRFKYQYNNVSKKQHVIIAGAGPAGLFAALRLIELGYKPVILERGKDVSSRKRDIARISREHIIDPDSNYCFGEGGAGTFSDGKLYTRSTKKGDNKRVLELLHFHGASDAILYESHPHIGTDKLPEIIVNIRKTILECGGEIHFNSRITELIIENDTIKGVRTQLNDEIKGNALILATGHSGRDIYQLLFRLGITLEAKPFAMGVRVEHPQEIIDSIQYHKKDRGKYLPAASYNLVTQIEDRGVYSFCMCPGGYIVPSATSPNEIVVNGMSSSRRHTPFANSGIVVEIRTTDLKEFESLGPLAGLSYQAILEQMAKINGGPGQTAPAQRLSDFVNNRISMDIPQNSYTPGLVASPMHLWLPEPVKTRLQAGLKQFEKKMHGFITNDACIAGVESRTSSPVRIPRDPNTLQHTQITGLFPCGEGSGYAGGISSSAMDGENAAVKVAEYLR